MSGLSLAVLWGALSLGGPPSPPGLGLSSAIAGDSIVGPGSSVPFVAQGDLLCGGAAAAMLERFWGARGVYAADFQSLVREREGGIRTDDLAAALVRRGYRVRAVHGSPRAAFSALAAGVPPILLLDGGRSLHYVVLVSSDEDAVRLHDPRMGPDRAMSRGTLLERWRASGFWALLVGPPSRAPGAPDSEGTTVPEPRSPALDSAMTRMRAGDYPRARAIATRILAGAPGSALARRISATSRYLEGDGPGALDDWNELSEPVVDLVEIRGAEYTRYDVLADQLGLRAGRLLTRSDLALARRRLAAVPTLRDTRLAYRPLPSGRVEVRATVRERGRWPEPADLLAEAVRSVAAQEVHVEAGPYLLAGDRWEGRLSWNPARQVAGGSISTALAPFAGVVDVDLSWLRERYGVAPAGAGTGATEERLAGSVGLRRWVESDTRLGVGVGLERWGGDRRVASGRLSVGHVLAGGRAWIEATGEGWVGAGRTFGRSTLAARARLPSGAHRAWLVDSGATVTSSSAPRFLWPGSGVGEIRGPLLRAHPLAVHGSIDGAAFAPRLVHATAEHRVFWRLGPLRAGGAAFVDAARVAGVADGAGAHTFVDAGVGAYAVSGSRQVMLSLATGKSGWVLSAQVGSSELVDRR